MMAQQTQNKPAAGNEAAPLPKSDAVPGGFTMGAIPADALEKVPNRLATRINEMRDLVASIQAQDSIIERCKNNLTKSRKDREEMVQKVMELAVDESLPITADTLRFKANVSLPTPDLFTDAAAQRFQAEVEKRKADKKAKTDKKDADDKAEATAQVAMGTKAAPNDVPKGADMAKSGATFPPLGKHPLVVKDATYLAEAVKVNGAAVAEGQEVRSVVVPMTDGEWLPVPAGGNFGDGVYVLLPLLTPTKWKAVGASLTSDGARNGEMVGIKVKDQASGKSVHVGPQFGAMVVADPAAALRHNWGIPQDAFPVGGKMPIWSKDAGLTVDELEAAAESADGLYDAAGEQVITLKMVRIQGNPFWVEEGKADADLGRVFECFKAYPAADWKDAKILAGEANAKPNDAQDVYRGVEVRGDDGAQYVLGGDAEVLLLTEKRPNAEKLKAQAPADAAPAEAAPAERGNPAAKGTPPAKGKPGRKPGTKNKPK